MTLRFLDLAFTDGVKHAQTQNGSRHFFERMEGRETRRDVLSPQEIGFIETRDSFYMSTVSENGWPYIQHRGGLPGFVNVLDDTTLAIADYAGNRQYVSLGNILKNNRVALFFMDYGRQARLKMLARVEVVEAQQRPELLESLSDPDYGAQVERGILFHLEAYDWNCPQHITPRFTADEVQPVIDELQGRIAELEAQVNKVD